MRIYPMVVDLSHWDPADDYNSVKNAGIKGIIYKATEGTGYTDDTYVSQQKAAKAVGLCWGAYHFADGSSVQNQINNFMRFACPDPDELFCLDWEDNPGGYGRMSASQAQQWIEGVEGQLNRPGECVIYSGNTAKELVNSSNAAFFGARRLWLCHYTTGTPTWNHAWDNYWLWQYTDGVNGSQPHSISGIGPCDINSFDRDGGADELIATWATGEAQPEPGPTPPPITVSAVNVMISAPSDVTVKVRLVGGALDSVGSRVAQRQRHEKESEDRHHGHHRG
jgi:lysozyme